MSVRIGEYGYSCMLLIEIDCLMIAYVLFSIGCLLIYSNNTKAKSYGAYSGFYDDRLVFRFRFISFVYIQYFYSPHLVSFFLCACVCVSELTSSRPLLYIKIFESEFVFLLFYFDSLFGHRRRST